MYKISNAGVIRVSDGKYIDNNNHADWAEYNKWLSQTNEPLPPDPQPPPVVDIEDLRDRKIENVKEIANRLRGKLNAGKTPAELTWFIFKYNEAKVFDTANPSATPFITAIATAAGVPPKQIANKIMKQYTDTIVFEGQIDGTYMKHVKALLGFATKQEIRNYDIKAGWPNVPLARPGDR